MKLNTVFFFLLGLPDGAFLLRESESVPGSYTISTLIGKNISNLRLQKVSF